MRVENGEVFVDVEFKEKFEPKGGDVIVSQSGSILLYSGWHNPYRWCGYALLNTNNEFRFNKLGDTLSISTENCRFATPEEKANFLERIEKECHKRWNAETKHLEDIRWRAEEGCQYWFVSTISADISPKLECNAPFDDERYDRGNYFRTPEAAQKVAGQIKEIFKNSKAE